MADYVLIDGDTAVFMPSFDAGAVVATVAVRPGTLTASGAATVGGKKMCIDGDEGSVSVPGCTYTTSKHVIPGVGTLAIDAVGGDQMATKTQTDGRAVLLVGGTFTAKFTVSSPAMQPPPGPGSPIPDSTTEYEGSGQFITTNAKFRGV